MSLIRTARARLRFLCSDLMRAVVGKRTRLRKLRKVARLARSRRYRAGLRRGVAGGVEHENVEWGHAFRTVIDVGANRGQFTLFALEWFPEAEVIAFEPLPSCLAVLLDIARAEGGRVSVVPLAVGDGGGTVTLFVSRREDSSSLLEIGPNQVKVFPETALRETVPVSMTSLDDALAENRLAQPCLLKIDVQGYELDVLRGAASVLDRVDEVLVEVSFEELYVGQPLAPAVVGFLSERGFYPRGFHSVVYDSSDRPLQADCHLVRTGSATPGAGRRSAERDAPGP